MRVLLVEDEELLCAAIERLLRGQGYEVLTARRPFVESALRILATCEVHAVILDLIFSAAEDEDEHLDGFDFIRRMSANGVLRNIPLFLASGLDEAVIRQRAGGAFRDLRVINIGKPLHVGVLFAGLKALSPSKEKG